MTCDVGYQRSLRVERLGLVPYGPMHALQQARHAAVAAGDMDDTLFLLQHERVITLGRNTGDGNVKADAEELLARGVELHATGRGGDVTYHGPGQIVGYPIVRLEDEERDIKRYVSQLEDILIRTADDFGIHARRVDGLRGIWVGDDKLAAIGVRLAQWTTLHGFAINVTTDLRDFELIVPCGIHGRGVTSMEKLLGTAPALSQVEDRLVHHARWALGRVAYEAEATPLPLVTSAPETLAVAEPARPA